MNEQLQTDADLAELLRATERARLRALVEADIATADRLHADDYQLITPGGMRMSKAAYLAGIGDGALRYRRFEPDGEVQVRRSRQGYEPDAPAHIQAVAAGRQVA